MSKHQIGYTVFGIFTILYAFGFFFWDWSIIFYLLAFIIWLIVVIYGSFSIAMNYHLKAISKVKINQKYVAITFDDGPSLYTNKALELLREYNGKATFFCVGKNLEKHPKVVDKVVENGHLIGNHSFSHSKIGFQSQHNLVAEIEKTDKLIEKVTQKKSTYYRPPFGVTNPSIRRGIQTTKHQIIGWNIRSLDTTSKSVNTILQRILKKIQPGSIILLHDTSQKSILVLEQLLLYLNKNNYRCVTIEELIEKGK